MRAQAPLRVAVLGAGKFVADGYVQLLEKHSPTLSLCAVWSRSQGAAEALRTSCLGFAPDCAAFHGDDGLHALLAVPEVQAVIVVLPPQVIDGAIMEALAAGKHVLSEKPAAATLAAAQRVLEFQRSLPHAPLWCVAENYRSEEGFLKLREAIAALGDVIDLNMSVELVMNPSNKYFASEWRRDTVGLPGGFLLEGSVHFLAALRMMAREAGFGEAVRVSAVTRSMAPQMLPAPDSMSGTVYFESGAGASFSMTMAAGQLRVALSATGTNGLAEAVRGGWGGHRAGYLVYSQKTGEPEPTQVKCGFTGVENNLLSFIRLVRGMDACATTAAAAAGVAAMSLGGEGSPSRPASPSSELSTASSITVRDAPRGATGQVKELPTLEDSYRVHSGEAMADLAVMEALLASAAAGGQLTPVAPIL